ncbi:MAG: copper resistance protein CopC [Betaproteobacteria bacterium]|nr:copper resistance protein CopC [Betaproteobacteria bacterium]
MSRRLTARIACALGLCVAAFAVPRVAWSHAFPDHQSPGAGVVLTSSPEAVKIWFDGDLEPIFSTITVQDGGGHVVAKGAVAAGQSDPTLLQAPLPKLGPGSYQVRWSVVARDGHRTEGRYTFIVQPTP